MTIRIFKAVLRILIIMVLVLCSIILGMTIKSIQKTWMYNHPVVPRIYQGYYLTQFEENGNEYDHITHISSHNISTNNSIDQIKTEGSYDTLPSDHQFIQAHLNFRIKRARILKNHQIILSGNTSKATQPRRYFKTIKKYHQFPPIKLSKFGFTFSRSGGIVKTIKLGHAKIVVSNLRIPATTARDIENKNADTI